jgi:hypothetical protein
MREGEGENRGTVETGETTEDEKLGLGETVERWERQTG